MTRNYRKSTFHGSASMRVLAALLAAAPIGVSVSAVAAGSLPANGKYISGGGSIQGTAHSLTIDQTGKAGIINWQSFSIGQGNAVQFNNGAGATLNKVTGNNLSQIAGSLKATGSVYLVNPAGVVVSPTGRVLTQGSFGAITGNAAGNIVNEGSIVSVNGDVILSGNNITDTGAVVSLQGGHIWLNAVGTANLGGTVSATSANGAGGAIVASGKTIDVTGSLQATGATRGGSIAVGSWSAGAVNVSHGATLNASATSSGNGGHISVVAGTTSFDGTAIARGGAAGGNGGTVETSGDVLDFSGGKVDASAAHGADGTWLLDPFSLTVDATAATTIDGTLNGGTNVLLQTTSSGCSGSGNCAAGAGDIDILAALGWNTTATLTLDAYHSINIDAPITISGAGGLMLTTNDGGSGGDYFFGNGASVAFTDIVSGATQGSLTINGTGFTLENTIASLASDISSNPGGDFALANSYNAAADGTYSQSPITTTFNGTFEGLGNTISNLAIFDTNRFDNVGLFSQTGSSAVLRDIGLVDATVAANTSNGVGTLAGYNSGSVVYSYATGSVSSNNAGELGGLIGYDNGSINQSYAAVAVSGGSDNGGLVGDVSSGSVSQSFATGIVSGGVSSNNGGLIGSLSGAGSSVMESYATGVVSGGVSSDDGGLIGDDSTITGSIGASYFDTGTSGLSASKGAGNVANDTGITGVTTAALQSGLPSGFSANAWAIVTGTSFPYLQWQFTGTPEVISGTALNGSSPAAGLLPLASIDGVIFAGTAWSSGANGYYSLLVPQGSISSGDQVLVYSMGANGGATLNENASGSLSGVDIYAGTLFEPTPDGNYSAVVADLGTAIGSNASLQSFVDTLPTQEIVPSAATFAIDAPIDVTTLILSTSGTITQTGAITATSLDLLGSGAIYQLTDNTNSIGTLAGNAGTIDLDNGITNLSIGTVDGTKGVTATTLTLSDTKSVTQLQAIDVGGLELLGSGGTYRLTNGANTIATLAGNTGTIDLNDGTNPLAIGTAGGTSGVTATTLTLTDTGNVTQTEAITTTKLDLLGSGASYQLTDSANAIGMLAGNIGTVDITDGTALTVGWADANLTATGPVTLTTLGNGSNLTITHKLSAGGTATLVSAGTLDETEFGTIYATTLTGSSAGGASLGHSNMIGTLSSFTNTGAGGFALTDDEALTVAGPFASGSGNVTLKSADGGIAIDTALSATTITLSATGLVTQSAAITATDLDLVGAHGNYQLTDSANTIGTLAGNTGTIDLNDGGNALVLGTTGGTNGVTATILKLVDTGDVTQSHGIDVSKLELLGTGGNYQLTSTSNIIGTLAGDTGDVAVTDHGSLTIGTAGGSTGLLASGSLALTSRGGSIAIDAALTGTTVDLVSTGTIVSNASGIITADTLTGSSAEKVVLTAANMIGDLGDFSVVAGGFSLTDAAALTVNGAVDVRGAGNLRLETTGMDDDLTIDATLTDTNHAVDLISAGTIADSGIITARTLRGSSAGTVMLTGNNVIDNLGAFLTGNGDFTLNDNRSLTVIGAVDAGSGTISLTTFNSGSNIAVDAALTGATVNLQSAGKVTENSTGAIIANLLNVTADTGITLTSSLNDIGSVGTDTTNSGPNHITL